MLKVENAYRNIREVADLLQVPASVLRFWETKFHQIKPIRRMGQRYYEAEDVVLLARIRDYLYKEGFTIKGVQKRLKAVRKNPELEEDRPEEVSSATEKLINDLTELKAYLSNYL